MGDVHARVERNAIRGNVEEVLPGDVVAAAEFEDGKSSHRGQITASISEPQNAVRDGELWAFRDVLVHVLAEQERGGSPARDLDGKIVDEGARPARVPN